jgi:S1-C subfamily serine protease
VKRLAVPLIAALALQGCAPVTPPQVFVGPGGGISTCQKSSTGYMALGLMGMAIDSNNYSDCCSTMWAAGFLEVERAGALGMMLSDAPERGHPCVARVLESSPASTSGVTPGDLIIAVGDQEVTSMKDAQRLLFGIAWTKVTVRFQRGTRDTTLTLLRATHMGVFGQYPPADGA